MPSINQQLIKAGVNCYALKETRNLRFQCKPPSLPPPPPILNLLWITHTFSHIHPFTKPMNNNFPATLSHCRQEAKRKQDFNTSCLLLSLATAVSSLSGCGHFVPHHFYVADLQFLLESLCKSPFNWHSREKNTKLLARSRREDLPFSPLSLAIKWSRLKLKKYILLLGLNWRSRTKSSIKLSREGGTILK